MKSRRSSIRNITVFNAIELTNEHFLFPVFMRSTCCVRFVRLLAIDSLIVLCGCVTIKKFALRLRLAFDKNANLNFVHTARGVECQKLKMPMWI